MAVRDLASKLFLTISPYKTMIRAMKNYFKNEYYQ